MNERCGRLELVVDGVIQSVSVPEGDLGGGYWPAMLPDDKPGSALLLGLGAGTVAYLLTRRFGPIPIVGVDDDPAILEIGRQQFGLGDLPHLHIVEQDAYSFAAACPKRFDYVAVDLARDGRIARRATAPSFVRQVRRLLTPAGVAVFNLALELPRRGRLERRISRLGWFLRVEKRVLAGFNVLVHCRPPAGLEPPQRRPL